MDDDLSRGLNDLERILDGSKKPGKLKLCVLSRITENFSDEQKIGQGGCGNVYKGILPSGQTVAVKKLLDFKTMDDRMFQQEVTAMMRVKHQNIVRFLGYCSHIEEQAMKIQGKYILVEERERLLCFDYMSKGSLADYVTDELRGFEWHTRFQIIKGICEGLYHLHKEKRIIHMDLKPPNILLDDDLVPKITDLGISRHGEISKTISLERLCSPGYCSPEYQFNGKMSFKSDVYSLGVIITEMVTGSRGPPNIAIVHRRWRHRWKKYGKQEHATLGYEQQVTKCLELAQRCQNWSPKERPNIQDIIRGINEVENTGTHSSDATESTAQQKNSFSEDMLGIEPLELHFSAELNKQISHSIQLTNDTDDYVAFRTWLGEKNIASRVSAASQLPFRMLPNKDVVPPRSSCSVTIKLESLKKPLREEHCIVELCVQSARVDIGFTAKDITADMFMEEPDKVVDMVNLTVSVRAPKQLLVVEPLELRYWPIEPNKLLPCSLQLTNRTDDYVAFAFILPKGKVHYYYATDTGIMRPRSTLGVVIDTMVEEEALAEMQCKYTCLVRSVVVDKGLEDHDVSMKMFYELTGVQEVELDIVFAASPWQLQPSSSVQRPMYEYDDEQDSEDDELELTRDQTTLRSPFTIETELLHIHPAELRFASEERDEYISLINRTDDDVIYAINYDHHDERDEDDRTVDETRKRRRVWWLSQRGVVPPQSTRAVPVVFSVWKKSYQVGVMMMMSGSRRSRTAEDVYGIDTYNELEELMNQVRAEGGKAHEALLACVVRSPHEENVETNKQHEMILRMDADGDTLQPCLCMDVHPTEPWVVTGHYGGGICIWKMDPKSSAFETVISAPKSNPSVVTSVKFIARMQWIACGDYYDGYITVYTYAGNGLAEIMRFQAEEGPVQALAVHPILPYLLSSSKCNLIKLWDWDQGWKCTKKFSSTRSTHEMSFNPEDPNSFVSLDYHGNINIWSMDADEPTTTWLRGYTRTVGIAYCNKGSDLQRIATVDGNGKIEILDLRSNTTTPVQALEVVGWGSNLDPWFIASHPTRPLLATAQASRGVLLWNYTTCGFKKVLTFKCRCFHLLGFIDMGAFQRLVIAHSKYIEVVDILDGRTF
ncbi:unnamed protein product [Urochloa humidicola]